MEFNRVCMYLRKSRADEEAEKHGAGETLRKHEQFLLEFAKERNINIVKIRKEVVSGESLIYRPKMLKTLKEIEKGLYDGILVMDMERLGRGNMQEQGLILETFKESDTKIITPMKTYDLSDEFDEEYSEFEAFMARKELKMINRRLQRGRIRSVEDGNFLGPIPPFGYDITYIDKCRTLKPNDESHIVEMIFDLYINHNMGGGKISNALNDLGYKSSQGRNWSSSLVLNVIKNEVYAGKIQWGKKEYKKSRNPGQVKEVRSLPRDEWISVKGKHPGLVSQEVFNKAQKILKGRSHVPYFKKITNPLAGLVICSQCGMSMVYRPYSKADPHIVCYNTRCNNKSSKFKFVEARLLKGLEDWLKEFETEWNRLDVEKSQSSNDNIINIHKQTINKLHKELKDLETQKNNLHDLLERGVYNIDTYLERSNLIADRIESANDNIKITNKKLQKVKDRIKAQVDIIPTVKKVLDLYNKTKDAEKKNQLLKSVIERTVYNKEKNQYLDEFTLTLHPRIKK